MTADILYGPAMATLLIYLIPITEDGGRSTIQPGPSEVFLNNPFNKRLGLD